MVSWRFAGRRAAFTLIELLVSIAIISLLIAMLVPSFARARKAVRRTVCASNLHGLMQSVYLYANDNAGKLVSVGLAHGGSVNEHAAWINTLRKHYGGNEKIARCPADESIHWDTPLVEARAPDDPPVLRRTSYGTNYYTVKKIGEFGPFKDLSMFVRPTTTIYLSELVEEGPFAASDHVHPETWWSNPKSLAGQELAYERHQGEANYAFIDGHVGLHKFEATYAVDAKRSRLRKIEWMRNWWDPSVAR